MKILFNTYPFAFHTPGGGEMQLLNYKRYLEKANVTVELFNQWQPDFLKADIVHFFSLMGGSIPFCEFVRKIHLPLVVTSSLWVTKETKHLYPFEQIQYQLSLADKVITNSQLESEQLHIVYKIPLEKFAVVYNGVDPIFCEEISPSLFRDKFNISYPFILNIANIEERKNQLTLLKAMQSFKDLKLITIGHIREETYAKKCFKLGGDQFVFLGPINHYDPLLRSAYAACEVFALPSTLETPGLAALEAAAQGAKVVVTGIGAPKEYFGTDAIYVDDPNNADEILLKINQALMQEKGKILAEKIKENFIWEKVVQSLLSIYNNVQTR